MQWRDFTDLLACPDCKGDLSAAPEREALACGGCGRSFEVRDGVPILLPLSWSDFAKRSVEWYERTDAFFERRYRAALAGGVEIPAGFVEYVPKKGIVLDCGSGAGLLTVLYARQGCVAIGLEVSHRGAVLGAELARKFNADSCLFVVGDAVRLPFRPAVFDCVTANGLLEHVHDIEGFAVEVARVLRSGGRIIAHDINRFLNPLLTLLRPSLDPGRLRLFWPALLPLLLRRLRPALMYRLRLDLSAAEHLAMGETLGQAKANRPLAYLVRDIFARHLRIVWYRTFLLHLGGGRYVSNTEATPVRLPVRAVTKLVGAVYHALNYVPVARHTGEAIYLVAEKA